MTVVRLENNAVAEIIPSYALPVEKWYGETFATQCVEAPDDVEQGMVYDPQTKAFSKPAPIDPQIDPITQIQLAVAELAEVSAQRDIENKLAIAELAEAMTGGK